MVDVGEIDAPDTFALLALCIAAVTCLAVVVLAFLGNRSARELHDFMAGSVVDAAEAARAVEPAKIQDALAQFEALIIARVQKTERAFVQLGEEVTDALDKADSLRRSASAKESRAKARLRKAEKDDDAAAYGNGADDDLGSAWWDRDDLSDEQKEQLTIKHLRQRGIAI